jgi:hypothetical protein
VVSVSGFILLFFPCELIFVSDEKQASSFSLFLGYPEFVTPFVEAPFI